MTHGIGTRVTRDAGGTPLARYSGIQRPILVEVVCGEEHTNRATSP